MPRPTWRLRGRVRAVSKAERQKNTHGCRCPSVNIPRGSQGNTAPWLGPVPERTARTRRRWVSNICPRTPAVCPNRSKPGEQTSAFPCRCWRLTLPASARSIEHSTVCLCVFPHKVTSHWFKHTHTHTHTHWLGVNNETAVTS